MAPQSSIEHPRSFKIIRASLALLLAFGIAGYAPGIAYADDAANDWSDATAQASDPDYSPYSSTVESAQSRSGSTFDDAFDLRDKGVVTPVKLQNPWGTCWGFAAIAASETSILSEMGTTYDDFPLDLSERQLAYFAYTPAPDFALDQEGEGAHTLSDNPNFMFNLGGIMTYATTMFSAGIGPLYEENVPYQNDEGIIICSITDEHGDTSYDYLTDAQIKEKREQDLKVEPLYYADYFPDPDDPNKAQHATWAVDEYYWLASSYELEESSILPEMCLRNEAGEYQGINPDSMNAVKSELTDGRAVSIAFFADTSQPNQQGEMKYINERNWAHYTYDENTGVNHAVTIVGWDDTYPASNFNSSHQPPGDGAWIVKNSWGAETEDFPNHMGWGVENDQGEHTGYFYLSYYDKSISALETFNYDLEDYTSEEEYAIDQYNYLITGNTIVNAFNAPAPFANVFTALEDTTVRTMTCETVKPNTTVSYELYLLDDDDANPYEGTKVAEASDTYEYGGFHRCTLPEEDWVPMREGQRYAVVVTQLCNDDGKYYQNVASNRKALTEEEAKKTRDDFKQLLEAVLMWGKQEELFKKFIDEGMSEEEAKAKAEEKARAFIETPDIQESIGQMVEIQYGLMIDTGFKGIVNPGESYTAGEGGTWSDWSNVIKGLDDSVVYDNFPIKAYADYRDYADIETLKDLQEAIDTCSAALGYAVVSADGSDVAKNELWVSQDDYDAFETAISDARKLMDDAGEDYETKLLATTPGQEEAETALDALDTAATAFKNAQKSGTMEPASAESLKQFEDKIKEARNDLLNTKTSVDGNDIPQGEAWVTQDDHDAFEAAISKAETAISAEHPSQADIDAAIADLESAQKAFNAAKKTAGTSEGGTTEPDDSGKDDPNDGAEQNGTDAQLVKTSDPLTMAAASIVVATIIAAVALATARRRIG